MIFIELGAKLYMNKILMSFELSKKVTESDLSKLFVLLFTHIYLRLLTFFTRKELQIALYF